MYAELQVQVFIATVPWTLGIQLSRSRSLINTYSFSFLMTMNENVCMCWVVLSVLETTKKNWTCIHIFLNLMKLHPDSKWPNTLTVPYRLKPIGKNTNYKNAAYIASDWSNCYNSSLFQNGCLISLTYLKGAFSLRTVHHFFQYHNCPHSLLTVSINSYIGVSQFS